PKLTLEVASIKPSSVPMGGPMRVGSRGGPGTPDPGRYTTENMSLSNLISTAYDLKRYQYSGPSWLDGERFDIVAKVPEGATKEQFRVMLQNLLAERFKVAVHREKKEMQVYELLVAKGGLKIKESVEEPAETPPGGPAAGSSGTAAPPPPPPPPPGGGGPMPRFELDKEGFPILPRSFAGKGPMMIMMNGRA